MVAQCSEDSSLMARSKFQHLENLQRLPATGQKVASIVEPAGVGTQVKQNSSLPRHPPSHRVIKAEQDLKALRQILQYASQRSFGSHNSSVLRKHCLLATPLYRNWRVSGASEKLPGSQAAKVRMPEAKGSSTGRRLFDLSGLSTSLKDRKDKRP